MCQLLLCADFANSFSHSRSTTLARVAGALGAQCARTRAPRMHARKAAAGRSWGGVARPMQATPTGSRPHARTQHVHALDMQHATGGCASRAAETTHAPQPRVYIDAAAHQAAQRPALEQHLPAVRSSSSSGGGASADPSCAGVCQVHKAARQARAFKAGLVRTTSTDLNAFDVVRWRWARARRRSCLPTRTRAPGRLRPCQPVRACPHAHARTRAHLGCALRQGHPLRVARQGGERAELEQQRARARGAS